MVGATSSLPVEQYRRVAATLHHAQTDRGLRVVMVTSALPREGKTLTTVGLAQALRHTGRPLTATTAMQVAFVSVFAAALLRLAFSLTGLGDWLLAGSALLWAVAFLAYLALHGAMPLGPSLPRQ